MNNSSRSPIPDPHWSEAQGTALRPYLPWRAHDRRRYSVLSKFGLVPAAAMGLDVKRLLETRSRCDAPAVPTCRRRRIRACSSASPWASRRRASAATR